jgi:iron(III) transport system substrate-binding protein
MKIIGPIVIVATLSATACSSGGSSGNNSAGSSSSSSGNWNSVVAQAKQEGTVSLFAGLPSNQLEALVSAFQKAYGIKVDLVQLSTVPLLERIQNDNKANIHEMDVAEFGDPASLASFLKQNIVINQNPDVPNAALWPSKYYSQGTAVSELEATTIAYNKNLVPASQAPTSWEDLTNPKWKGQIGIFDPSSVNAAQPFEYLYETYGSGYLKALGQQDIKDYSSGSDQLAALASGEIKIAAIAQLPNVEPLIAEHAPVALVQNIPTPGFVSNFYVAQGAPHPAAARVLLNFIMSKAGQQSYLAPNIGVSPIDVPGAIPTPAQFVVANAAKTAENLNTMRSLLGLPQLPNS